MREAAFIQVAMARGGDVQSVVSAPLWMACGIGFHQVQDEMREWVLLDTASTVSVFLQCRHGDKYSQGTKGAASPNECRHLQGKYEG
jgi:hypothetical protein